jgi:hypothetical protein
MNKHEKYQTPNTPQVHQIIQDYMDNDKINSKIKNINSNHTINPVIKEKNNKIYKNIIDFKN